MELYNLIMGYRKERNLPTIPISVKLTLVAQAHTRDLNDHFNLQFSEVCNLHSWSSKGPWSYCCYTNDHRQKKCMWNKPKEIAGYLASGYEIVSYKSSGSTAKHSFIGWKLSEGHNPLLINEGEWAKLKWRAIGISINRYYSSVWFGERGDTDHRVVCP